MPKRSDDVDLDLVEQCRAGDREAFRALLAFWGDPAMRVVAVLVRDDSAARAVLKDAFRACWEEMPSMHSETPFRPLLLGLVVRTANARTPTDARDELSACLRSLDAELRAAAALVAGAGLGDRELGLALGVGPAVARERARRARRTMMACLGRDARAPLARAAARGNVDRQALEALSDALAEHRLLEVRRMVPRGAQDVWNVLTDPTALAAWISADGVRVRGGGAIYAGAHIAARGRIADLRRSRDETVITIAEQPRLLAWTTRSLVAPFDGTIEFRWTLAIEDSGDACELTHVLRGVAFPRGVRGVALRRAYAHVEGSMQSSMHRGVERLATLVEASTR
ncbi:MAG: SRPBCC family protein [Actinomycetota bacterium]